MLEVMWGERCLRKAPRYFFINSNNFTGRRLYDWLDGRWKLVVTNACPQMVDSANGRGTPEPSWLGDNLSRLSPIDLLLVCGKVAQSTYAHYYKQFDGLGLGLFGRVLFVPHPAARGWSREGLDRTKWFIQEGEANLHIRLTKRSVRVTKLEGL